MPAYARVITIGGRDYTTRCETCSFSWSRSKGCVSASLSIQSAGLDDFCGVVLGEVVQISYSAGDSWFYGIVKELNTSLTSGLSISAQGIVDSIFQETNVKGMYGDQATTIHPTNFTGDFESWGNLGEGYHTYYLAAVDDVGSTIPAGGDWSLSKKELHAVFNGTGAQSSLLATITATATSFTLPTGAGSRFPSSAFVVRMGEEDIYVTTRTADSCTGCTRGYWNTRASQHFAGTRIYYGNNARRALLMWDSSIGAKQYRVYKAIYPAMTPDPPSQPPVPYTTAMSSSLVDDVQRVNALDNSLRSPVYATTELATAITSKTATSFTVLTGSGAKFPTAAFYVRIYKEIVYVATRSGDTFSGCTRAAQGTTAGIYPAGQVITTGSDSRWDAKKDPFIGMGVTSTAPTPLYYAYIDTPNTLLYDDGSIDWFSLPAVVTLPAAKTAHTSPAASSKVIDIVKYLVSTYASDHYDVSLVTGGNSTDHTVDLLNLDDADSNLAQALDTLAKYAGEINWGVNGNGMFFFKGKIKTTQSDYATYIINTFRIGNQFNKKDPSVTTDVLIEATRSTTRDGITEIRVLGNKAANSNGVSAFGWLKQRGAATGYLPGSAGQKENDPATVQFTVNPNAPSLVPTYDYVDSYASAAAFEVDYPGLGWIWKNKDLIAKNVLEAYLLTIASKYQRDPATGSSSGCSRPKGMVVWAPGLESDMAMRRVAAGVMSEALPVIGNWNITIDIATVQYPPGSGLVQLQTQGGKFYILEIQSTNYDFNECVTASVQVGEMDILNHESIRKTAYAAAGGFMGLPNRNRGMVAVQPKAASYGGGFVGNVGMPADEGHQHPHDPELINVALMKDAALHPNISRKFVGESLTQINDQADSTKSTYVRGLVFTEGDVAVTLNQDGATSGHVTKVYDRKNGAWVERSGTWIAYTGA